MTTSPTKAGATDRDLPAFPCEWDYIATNRAAANGMTLRDAFAAKALQFAATQYAEHGNANGWDEGWRDGVAIEAYAMADAMLRARSIAAAQGGES